MKLEVGMLVKWTFSTHAPCADQATCPCTHHPRGRGIMARWEHWTHERIVSVEGFDGPLAVVRLDRSIPEAREIGLDGDGFPIFERCGESFEESIFANDVEEADLVQVIDA